MDTMKALVLKDVGKLVQENLPIPHVVEPDDVLLKIKAVGICGSDVKICLLYTSPSPRDRTRSRMPSSA